MPKYKKKASKKTASSSQSYEMPTSQSLTESSSKDQAEFFNCDKCAVSTESLLQCEYCSTWYCFKCSDIPEEMFSTIGGIKNLHWFCSACDVIIVEFITKSNPSGAHSVLKDMISTVIHQSLDRAMSQFIKVFTRKTNQLEKSLNEIVHGVEETNMDTLQKSDPSNLAANINTPQGHSVLKAVDEYVEREKRKNNLIFYNLSEPTNVLSNKQRVLKDIECLSDLVSSEFGISKVQVNCAIRLGAPNQTKPRLLLVQFADISTKRAILRQRLNFKKVPNSGMFIFHQI